MQPRWNMEIFSMCFMAKLPLLIFLTDPGLILLMSSQRTTPVLRFSSNDWAASNGAPVTDSIHACVTETVS